MRPAEGEGTRTYCLFPYRSSLLAVRVEAVETVVEAARLVRLPLCPAPVLALCIYRNGLVPIHRPAGAGADWPAESPDRRRAVLVLRTPHGPLGLLIRRGEVAFVADGRAGGADDCGEPSPIAAGVVVAGALEHEGKAYAVLDPGRTWKAVREAIERGYGSGGAGARDDRKPTEGDPAS
jgi:hypothetical protein